MNCLFRVHGTEVNLGKVSDVNGNGVNDELHLSSFLAVKRPSVLKSGATNAAIFLLGEVSFIFYGWSAKKKVSRIAFDAKHEVFVFCS